MIVLIGFIRLRFDYCCCVVVFLTCLLGASITHAQELADRLITRTLNAEPSNDIVQYYQSKDWSVKCDYIELKSFRRCELSTIQVYDEGEGPERYQFKIVLDGKRSKPLAIIQTPLDLLLSKGVDFKIDNSLIGKLTYRSCHQTGCVVPFSVAGSVDQRIRNGLKTNFTFYDLGGEKQTVEFSLIGITKALRVARDFF